MSALVRITSNAGLDEQVEFPVVLKSQIMTLRKELGEQTPAPIEKDTFSQESGGSKELPLPMDVSPADRSGSRVTGKVSGTGSTVHSSTPHLQGGVLHAPPSAYPQVMPGSLPTTRPARRVGPGPSNGSTRFSYNPPVDREIRAVPMACDWVPAP